jgi:gas vesicle protein
VLIVGAVGAVIGALLRLLGMPGSGRSRRRRAGP